MLEGLTPTPRKFPCAVRTLIETLEAKDSKIFQEAIQNLDWRPKTLSRALRDRGIVLSDDSIARHRRGQCSCSKI
jgi:predicted metalloendopeptidase